MKPAATALRAVEAEFLALVPEITSPSTAYVSVQSAGVTSIYAHIHRYQCLRVWYRNPRLVTLTPERWRASQGAERLFWISADYHVFEVNLTTLRPRTSGPKIIGSEYERVLRRYAVGRSSAGDLRRAVAILTRIDANDIELRAYDWRLAGALLLASGREEDARQLLKYVPTFKREPALDVIMTTIGDLFSTEDRDEPIMRAFGISPTDASANRSLMLGLERYGWARPARRFAARVLAVNPSDPDAKRVLAGDTSSGALRLTIPPLSEN